MAMRTRPRPRSTANASHRTGPLSLCMRRVPRDRRSGRIGGCDRREDRGPATAGGASTLDMSPIHGSAHTHRNSSFRLVLYLFGGNIEAAVLAELPRGSKCGRRPTLGGASFRHPSSCSRDLTRSRSTGSRAAPEGSEFAELGAARGVLPMSPRPATSHSATHQLSSWC